MYITVVPQCCCAVSVCSDDPWSVLNASIKHKYPGSFVWVKGQSCQLSGNIRALEKIGFLNKQQRRTF